MSHLCRLALLLIAAVFATGALAASPLAPGCTVKSRSSAQAGPHAHASSEASADCDRSWVEKLAALLLFIYTVLRHPNRKDDKWRTSR